WSPASRLLHGPERGLVESVLAGDRRCRSAQIGTRMFTWRGAQADQQPFVATQRNGLSDLAINNFAVERGRGDRALATAESIFPLARFRREIQQHQEGRAAMAAQVGE